MPRDRDRVDRDVQRDDERAERELQVVREPRGIEDRQDVVLD